MQLCRVCQTPVIGPANKEKESIRYESLNAQGNLQYSSHFFPTVESTKLPLCYLHLKMYNGLIESVLPDAQSSYFIWKQTSKQPNTRVSQEFNAVMDRVF